MMKLLLALGLLLMPLSAANAQMTPPEQMPSGAYSLDRTHAALVWKISHLGLSEYIGRFTNFDVNLDFNAEAPEQSTLKVHVDPMSLATDYPFPDKTDFSKELATGEQWLNAGAFPKIEFVSKSIEMTGEKTAVVHGDLTFLGVTKPLALDVVFNGAYAEAPFSKVPALGFSAKGVLKRSDWGLNTYVPMIGDDVELEISVELHGQAVLAAD